MRKIKFLIVIALFATSFGFGQSAKIGHISTEQLISIMPETQTLNLELEKLTKTYEAEIKAESEKFEAKLKKYEAEAPSQTEDVNRQRQLEVQKEQQSLYAATQAAREEIAKKRDEKLKPILEKAKKAIEDVANEGNYTYVIEASTLIVAKGTDLLSQVKAKLSIK